MSRSAERDDSLDCKVPEAGADLQKLSSQVANAEEQDTAYLSNKTNVMKLSSA
jgi:hypothetical protein